MTQAPTRPGSVPGPLEQPLPCHRCGAPLAPGVQRCASCGAAARGWSPRLHATDPAAVRRRLLAALVDGVPALAALVAVVLVLVRADDPAPWWWVWLTAGALWVLLVALLDGVRGASPGKLLCSLATVDVVTTGPIGALRGLQRTAVKGGTALLTLGLAGLSHRTDPDVRERCWWDRVAGSRVVAGSAGHADGVPAAVTGGAATAARWAPRTVPAAPVPSGVPATGPAAPPARPTPQPPAVRPTPQPSAVRPTPQPPAAGPTTQPPRPATGPRPAAGAPQPDAAAAVSRPPGVDAVRPGGWGAAPLPGGRRVVDGIPGGPPGVVADPAPTPAAASGGPGQPTDEIAGARRPADATRVVPRDALGFRATTATLAWDTGTTVVVGGTVIIGRDPVAAEGEHVDRRLAVDAGSVGVSKTHVALSITTGGITVTDRHSTNGVRIEHPDGSTDTCTPGEPTAVRAGDRIRFGGRSLTLVSG